MKPEPLTREKLTNICPNKQHPHGWKMCDASDVRAAVRWLQKEIRNHKKVRGLPICKDCLDETLIYINEAFAGIVKK